MGVSVAFPGSPPNSWMVYDEFMENPMNMDDLEVPLSQDTSICVDDKLWKTKVVGSGLGMFKFLLK